MPWTRRIQSGATVVPRSSSLSSAFAGASRSPILSISVVAPILLSALFSCTLLLSGAPSEKHLSVYSTVANYSLPLVQREERDYVGLLELLEPLGKVSAKLDGARWRLRYNNVVADFQAGKTHAQIQGRDADLGGKFLFENGRGMVPVGSLGALMPRVLGGPVVLHEESDRVFIGSVATHFTASLSGDPSRLILHFTAPVNPSVATEPGALRMTFAHEPLVAPASPTLTFGSKSIPSAIYSESNGMAVLTVNAAIPVMASFGNDGRTITVSPAAAPASATPNPATQNIPPGATPAPATPAPGQQLRQRQPRLPPAADILRLSMPAMAATITAKL